MQRQLIDEQIAYYRARASENDDGGSDAGVTIVVTHNVRDGLPKLSALKPR